VKLELPVASKSKVNSGFVAGQLLSGLLVPWRASNFALHCTEPAQQKKRMLRPSAHPSFWNPSRNDAMRAAEANMETCLAARHSTPIFAFVRNFV
jgi:hypothetical protein